ncbi:MAG: ABC transporter permease [Ignavibacteria bacterium]|nr:ABC transporter permease [Ignavibacteria bacterium]
MIDIVYFTIKRMITGVLLVLCLLSLVFIIAHAAPGDPILSTLSPRVSASVAAEVREHFGLDKPLHVQFTEWMRNCLVGNFGVSISHGRPVGELVATFLPNTIVLALVAIVIELVLGLFIGLMAARHEGSFLDRCVSSGSMVLFTLPTFWIGIVLLAVFSYALGLLPSSQMFSIGAERLAFNERTIDFIKHLILPAITVAIPGTAALTRYFRASLIKLQHEEYLTYATSFGVPRRKVFLSYELPNAVGPVVTLLGLELGTLLTGALVTETMYAWPGMGRLAVMAIVSRDYPLIMGCTVVAGAVVILGNCLADVLYMLIDPRVET